MKKPAGGSAFNTNNTESRKPIRVDSETTVSVAFLNATRACPPLGGCGRAPGPGCGRAPTCEGAVAPGHAATVGATVGVGVAAGDGVPLLPPQPARVTETAAAMAIEAAGSGART